MANTAAVRVVRKLITEQLNFNRRLTPSDSQGYALPNPFIAHKSAKAGKWRPPTYSLREQAKIVKAARVSGLLHLLPPGPKTPTPPAVLEYKAQAVQKAREAAEDEVMSRLKEELQKQGSTNLKWLQPVTWTGKMKEKAPGAELGVTLYAGKKRMFKGHKWERVYEDRKKKQAVLLRDMKKRIYNYKNFYKRRKPDPLKPPRTLKSPKLPF